MFIFWTLNSESDPHDEKPLVCRMSVAKAVEESEQMNAVQRATCRGLRTQSMLLSFQSRTKQSLFKEKLLREQVKFKV
jgi:hypothetical protein